jgi:hypothetical protein
MRGGAGVDCHNYEVKTWQLASLQIEQRATPELMAGVGADPNSHGRMWGLIHLLQRRVDGD